MGWCFDIVPENIINTGVKMKSSVVVCELYRVFQLDMTYFEVQDGQLKITSKPK